MSSLSSYQIRQKYLDFFKSKGHAIISPAFLIPENDPTLLFTNSGMFPLVPYLLGEKHPAGTRLADSQPSFRTDDIEEVGDGRHITLFEMLGNWSLNDYWKEEQLNWWYEFLIEHLGLDIKRLYQSVYAGDVETPRWDVSKNERRSSGSSLPKDDDSVLILKKIFAKYGIEATEGPTTTSQGSAGPGVEIDFSSNQRIFTYRDKNWWQRGDAVGELGGPDSETFYDSGKSHNPKYGQFCHLNCDCGRFIEFGNSVFMQYQKTKSGWTELQQKNVDFGGGLERLAMVVQQKFNAFQTDLFWPLIEHLEKISSKTHQAEPKAFEVIADHIRAATFLIADGAVPSNLAQGYFVRRLIRRAIRFGRLLGFKKRFLPDLVNIVVEILKDPYSHLEQKKSEVIAQIEKEETKFNQTIERGLKEFARISESGKISGRDAFILYSTYGFPLEMTQELAAEKGIAVDEQEFKQELEKHQNLSRTASTGMFKGGLADQTEQTTKLHTATHLMLQALRQILGDHVQQKGSNITAERIRFDFSHSEKVSADQLEEVEQTVNQAIAADLPVKFEEMTVEEAEKEGAVGVFKHKYGEKVKVYFIGQKGSEFSKEICGGPHVAQTGILGKFEITKEESSSLGVRRIKARLIS